MTDIQLSIIIPCYNEKDSLPELYKKITGVIEKVDNLSYQLIFVNDGSTDGSEHILRQIFMENPEKIKIINLSRNFGKEIAIMAGIDHADGESVLLIDADLQHPPEKIVDFVNLYRTGKYDIIQGIKLSRNDENLLRNISSIMFYRMFNFLSDIKIEENSSDYILLSNKALKAFKSIRERERFNRGLFSWIGFQKGYVYFHTNRRSSGKSKFNAYKLLKLAIDSVVSFSTLPLRIASVIGVSISGISFMLALIIVLQKIFFGIEVKGYASVIVAVFFLGGIQLIFLGVIGEYIAKIYSEVKNRPPYIIKEIMSYDKPG